VELETKIGAAYRFSKKENQGYNMDSWIIILMLGVSVFLGLLALIGIMWAIKTGQFDDKEKFLHQVQYDGEDELNDAVKQQAKKELLKKRKEYRPE
jgi:cbb3-type cytochrome oxidase maturation protein